MKAARTAEKQRKVKQRKVIVTKRPLVGLDRNREAVLSFENLITSLQVVGSARSLKSILVTSSQPGEGKTTVTVNLAVALALAGRKTNTTPTTIRIRPSASAWSS